MIDTTSILNCDILNIIFYVSSNKNLIFVNKLWHSVIMYSKITCPICNKVIKICNHDIWLTEDGDVKCHTHYLQIKKHKILDLEIINLSEFEELIECLSCEAGIRVAYIGFISKEDKNKMVIEFDELVCRNLPFISSEINETYFTKFICTKKETWFASALPEFKALFWHMKYNDTLQLSIYNTRPNVLVCKVGDNEESFLSRCNFY